MLGTALTTVTGSGPITVTAGVVTLAAGGAAGAYLGLPSSTTLGGVKALASVAKQYLTSIGTDGIPVASQPASSDLSDITTLSISTSGTFASSAGTSSFKQVFIGTAGSAGVNVTSPSDGNLTLQNNAASANANLTIQNLLMSGLLSQYNGLTLAGLGLVAVVARGHLAGQTSAAASVATFTPASDGTFEICATALITAFTSGALNVRVSYVDDNNVSRTTDQLSFLNFAGGISSGPNSTFSWRGLPCQIRAKGGSAITIFTNGTFSLTYDIEGIIKQVA